MVRDWAKEYRGFLEEKVEVELSPTGEKKRVKKFICKICQEEFRNTMKGCKHIRDTHEMIISKAKDSIPKREARSEVPPELVPKKEILTFKKVKRVKKDDEETFEETDIQRKEENNSENQGKTETSDSDDDVLDDFLWWE